METFRRTTKPGETKENPKQATGLKKYAIITVLIVMTVGFVKSLYDFRQEAKKFDLNLRSLSDLWWIGLFTLVNLVSRAIL
jgi:hypothetical protein